MTTELDGVRGQRHAPAALYPGKDPVPTVQEAGWAPGPVWRGAENLASTGIRSPDRAARSQSLYRLRYPAHIHSRVCNNFCFCTATLVTRTSLNVTFICTPPLGFLMRIPFFYFRAFLSKPTVSGTQLGHKT